jgi:MYXO-CTERM domain-containing protein
MKKSNLPKFVGSAVLTLSMAIMPLTLPASAQTDTTSPGTGGAMQSPGTGDAMGNDRSADVAGEQGDRDFDWGWLGLLGLAGLAGLAKRNEPVRYQDPNVAGTTTYRE